MILKFLKIQAFYKNSAFDQHQHCQRMHFKLLSKDFLIYIYFLSPDSYIHVIMFVNCCTCIVQIRFLGHLHTYALKQKDVSIVL